MGHRHRGHADGDCGCVRHGHRGHHGRHAGWDCGCGHRDHHGGWGCGCGHHGHHAGRCGCGGHHGLKRRYWNREEKTAWLERYLEDLENEVQAVRERLAEMKEG